MLKIPEITSRYQPTEKIVTCSIRILREGKWYQMPFLEASISYCKEVIRRLRRKGRTVDVVYLTGMGLKEFVNNV